MSAKQSVARLIKKAIWFFPARRFRKNTAEAIAHIEDILPVIERQWCQANELELAKYLTLYNSMSFLLLLHYDLAVLAYDHATEIDERKQNLYARQLCLHMHEALDDLPRVFGGSFRKAAVSLPNGDDYLQRISEVLKMLRGIGKEHQAQIAEVRHFVAAHRDHDSRKQLEVMRKIDNLWLMAVSGQFIEFLGKMTNAITPLLLEMGKPAVILKHMANRD